MTWPLYPASGPLCCSRRLCFSMAPHLLRLHPTPTARATLSPVRQLRPRTRVVGRGSRLVPKAQLSLAPAPLYAVLAVLGTNIGLSDLFDTASVGTMLGYAPAVAHDALSLSAVRLSGGTHFPVAAALASLFVSSRRADNPAEALPDKSQRLLSLGLSLAVLPLCRTVAAWANMTPPGQAFPPIILFILFRLALEASAGLLPLLRTPGALKLAVRDTLPAPPATASAFLLLALQASSLGSCVAALAAPGLVVQALWGPASVPVPALAADLIPALAGAFIAAAAVAAALYNAVLTKAARGQVAKKPHAALCVGLGALGVSHLAVHAASSSLLGCAMAGLCVLAAASSAKTLLVYE